MRYVERRPTIDAIQVNRAEETIRAAAELLDAISIQISLEKGDPKPVTFALKDHTTLKVGYGDFVFVDADGDRGTTTREEFCNKYETAANR